MENSNEQKEMKKLTREESIDAIFKHLSDLSGCFEPEGKKIMFGKIKNLEKEYKIESEMKLALSGLSASIKRKSAVVKEFVLEKTESIKAYIAEKIKEHKRRNYFKNKEKQLRNKEKYEH